MHSIRRTEIVAGNLYKAKIVRGFCHLYNGQEAICVGMKAAMSENDCVITAYRAHGWTYIMGTSIYRIFAELAGRKTGVSRGRGGSMHMYARNFYGGNGIVGAQIPLGTGVALANKYRKNGSVCIALYGDGAANQGQVFESYNMAMLWKLPVIFVCENNRYAMGTSADRSSTNIEYYTRGGNIPGIKVDGMDLLTVRNASKFALEYARENGPLIMEMVTYRYMGHSMSDPGTSYRTRDEVTEYRKYDPIKVFEESMLNLGIITEETIQEIKDTVHKEIKESEAKALKDAEPLGELVVDIQLNSLEPKIRSTNYFNLKHSNKGKQYVEDEIVTPENVPDKTALQIYMDGSKKARRKKSIPKDDKSESEEDDVKLERNEKDDNKSD